MLYVKVDKNFLWIIKFFFTELSGNTSQRNNVIPDERRMNDNIYYYHQRI